MTPSIKEFVKLNKQWLVISLILAIAVFIAIFEIGRAGPVVWGTIGGIFMFIFSFVSPMVLGNIEKNNEKKWGQVKEQITELQIRQEEGRERDDRRFDAVEQNAVRNSERLNQMQSLIDTLIKQQETAQSNALSAKSTADRAERIAEETNSKTEAAITKVNNFLNSSPLIDLSLELGRLKALQEVRFPPKIDE